MPRSSTREPVCFIPVRYDLHARKQSFLLSLQAIDFLDVFFKDRDFGLEAIIARLLGRDQLRIEKHGQHDDGDARKNGATHGDAEVSLTFLSFRLAPGE